MPGTKGPIHRGSLFLLAPDGAPGPLENYPHPHVVVQDDVFNHSRIATVIVCALTSNLHRATEPGNVLLDVGEGNLPKRSVVVVSQIDSVEKSRLIAPIGSISDARVEQIIRGLGFQQASFFRRQWPSSPDAPRDLSRPTAWKVGPILGVSDVTAAVEFFCQQLGFEPPERVYGEAEPVYAIVHRGGIDVHLQVRHGARFTGTRGIHDCDAYFHVDDAAALSAEFRANGVKFLRDLQDEPYGIRDFTIETPDGHRLVFGTPL